jgi:hypothetical protein
VTVKPVRVGRGTKHRPTLDKVERRSGFSATYAFMLRYEARLEIPETRPDVHTHQPDSAWARKGKLSSIR